ncbi:uncharacterized protein [Hetaerina americana]|uniref:uncharacterized protein n=1 Tax=Hetaerina americana TaxID=62018 RepID=UPI003A7F44EB
MSSEETKAQFARTSIRIPPFWPEDPAVWFAQVEGLFRLNGITEDATMYYLVMSQLSQKHAAEVSDTIISPPADGKYSRLKEELILRLTASEEQRIRQLLEHEEIGDHKPSQLLRHLRTLVGPTVPDTFLRTLWLNRLLATTRAIVTVQDGGDLDGFALLADRVHEVAPKPQVSSASTSDVMLHRVDKLTRQVAALAAQVSQISATVVAQVSNSSTIRARSRSHGHARSSSRRRSQSRNAVRQEGAYWYHTRQTWRSVSSSSHQCHLQGPRDPDLKTYKYEEQVLSRQHELEIFSEEEEMASANSLEEQIQALASQMTLLTQTMGKATINSGYLRLARSTENDAVSTCRNPPATTRVPAAAASTTDPSTSSAGTTAALGTFHNHSRYHSYQLTLVKPLRLCDWK